MLVTYSPLVNELLVLSLGSEAFKSALGLFIAVNSFQSQYKKKSVNQIVFFMELAFDVWDLSR